MVCLFIESSADLNARDREFDNAPRADLSSADRRWTPGNNLDALVMKLDAEF